MADREPPPSAPPPADAAANSLAVLAARHGPRYRWILIWSVMVGVVASIMSSTVVNVAIPEMSQHFSLGQDRAQWVTSGFMVASTATMLLTPWLLGRFGYRRTYAGTMWLLMAGGIAGGLSNNYTLVLVARVVEGLAAGVVQPIPAIIMMRAFEPHEQGRATSIFGMGVVLAPALGPSIGGLLVSAFGWRSIFFMVVPFCLAALWLAWKFVPDTGPGGAAMQRESRLDWLGLGLASTGTVCLLNGLVDLQGGSGTSAATLLFVAGLCLAAFIAWQRRARARGRETLMNLDLFTHRTYSMGVIVSFIFGAALFGSTYLLPVYIQLGLDLPAAHAGTILLPAGLILGVTIGLVGRITHRVPIHLLVMAGLAMLAISFVLTTTVSPGQPLALLVAWTMLGRVGLGFIMPSLNVGAMRSLDKSLIAHGASAINFMRMLGGSAGVGLCAIVLEWRIAAHGDSLTRAGSSPGRLAAFDEVFMMLAAVCGLGILAAWQLRGPPPPAAAGQ